MLFNQSGILLAPEEILLRASLMARDLPLGPSDVPCPVKTPTAHGDSFFWATVFLTVKDKASWISASISNHAYRVLLSNLLALEKLSWSHISSSSPASRHALTSRCSSTLKLGFHQKGLVLIIGPLPSWRPKPIKCDPTPIDIKPRSVFSILLSTFSQCLGCFFDLTGRRHHLREKSPSLLWVYNYIMRTLELASNKAMFYESKLYGLLFSNQNCWRSDYGKVSMPNYDSTTTLSKNLMLQPIANTPKIWILCYHPSCTVKQNSSECLTMFNRSFVDVLEPARITSLASSSTSPSLLTVTNLPSIDSFVEGFSTNRDLTCFKPLASLCLKALMEPMSIYFNYPFVALENVFLCCVLNFGSFESPTLFVLGLF